MTWVRIDDRFPQHRKAVAAGPLGRDLYICGLCYCNAYLTDGFIPRSVLRQLAPGEPEAKHERGRSAVEAIAKRLVSVGLWEDAEGGWRVHDYAEWNKSRADIEELKALKRKAGSIGGRKSGEARRKHNASGSSEANTQARAEGASKPSPLLSYYPPIPPPAHASTATEQQRRLADLAARLARPIAGATAPPEAWRHDCPQPVWHGRCVDRAWAAAHPDVSMPVVPDDHGGYRPRECPFHADQPPAQ